MKKFSELNIANKLAVASNTAVCLLLVLIFNWNMVNARNRTVLTFTNAALKEKSCHTWQELSIAGTEPYLLTGQVNSAIQQLNTRTKQNTVNSEDMITGVVYLMDRTQLIMEILQLSDNKLMKSSLHYMTLNEVTLNESAEVNNGVLNPAKSDKEVSYPDNPDSDYESF